MILTNTSNSHLSNITLYYYYILFKLTSCSYFFFFFFLNDPATPEIYTLPLHDALPISERIAATDVSYTPIRRSPTFFPPAAASGSHCPDGPLMKYSRRPSDDHAGPKAATLDGVKSRDRKSTRLNSSHLVISYAVFCLKK